MTSGGTAGIRFGSRPSQDKQNFPFDDPQGGYARLRDLPWSPAQTRQLDALSRETDPEILYRDLVNFGRQLEAAQPELAAELYSAVLQETPAVGAVPPLTGDKRERPLRTRAQEHLDAILGRGAFGPRAEFLLRNLAQQSSDPAMLSAMGTAGAVFRMTRLATLSRLAATPNPGFLTQLIGAGRLASLTGFALEAPAFTLAGRLGNEVLGRRQDWSGAALGRDFASSYLVLGGLKLAGHVGANLVFALPARGRTQGSPLQLLFQQGSMLAGIMLGHSLEERLGLRPHLDGATTLVDSLALLLQFHVAGALSRPLFGGSFGAWPRRLDLQAEPSGSPLKPALGPRLAWALPLEPQVRARELNILMEGENAGRPSPPMIRGRRGSDPPPDEGTIGRDAQRWGAAQGRDSESIRLVAHLAARLRVELWNALNLRIEGHVAASIARRRELLVRLVPIDGSLDNYALELHPRGRLGPQSDPSEIRFLLNTADGSLRLQDFLPNAVWELRRQQAGLPPVAGFLPFYRSIQGFASEGLKAQPLLDTLPPAAKEYVLMEPTRELKRPPNPAPVAAPASPAPATPKPAFTGPTLLVAYFPRIMAGVRESVDRYLDEMMIRGEKERKRLHGLAQHILLTLHQREVEDPEVGTVSNLQIWIRPSPQGQGRRSIEVLSPMEGLLKNQEQPYGPEDILLILSRNPGYLGTEVPTLEHQYLRHNRKNPRIPAGEDLEFQRDLGLGDHLRLRMTVHDLSLRPPDLASWQRWMEEHVRGAKPPDLP
ncbi:MAG: hypothetical protein IT572_04540 [Deltaproteobacteria bacterium]|nr:hypothetical protein [Deltaproteobacteria bacterium]